MSLTAKPLLFVALMLGFIMLFAGSSERVSAAPPSLHPAPVCRGSGRGYFRCHAQVLVDANGIPHKTPLPSGYGPAQFQTAYTLTGTTSSTQTIAIVDAFDNPNVLADLNYYSQTFKIPQLNSCPVANGTSSSPCFQKVDQNGGTNYPQYNSSWAAEIGLDVEVAHAICENCNILLVEANTSSYSDLMTAVDQARLMGANVISNSYGSIEFSTETSLDSHFNYSGIAITFSSGDGGYGVQYPAASPYVTAVGGTTLYLRLNYKYKSEIAWKGAGSGCSAYEAKPSFQKDTGCSQRTVADVSADADPTTGAAVWNTSLNCTPPYCWFQVGGTSLSSPLIAGVYALAGGVKGGVQGNAIPYSQGNYRTNLHDVISGNNGNCGTYLCTAGSGYDGPTGLGTPKGTGGF